MAYADRNTTGSRMVAIVIVSILVAAFGYAFVTGLTYKYVKKLQDKLNTFDVTEPPPPPPDKPPPPPPDTPLPPPPAFVPPVQNPVPAPPPPIQVSPTMPPPAPPVAIIAPAAPPAPPPPRIDRSATAKGNPADWITQDDYPAAALRAEATGTTAITWDINTQGKVENCRVTSSSGNADLDSAACKAITRRGKYSPALDQNGTPIRMSQSRRVVWRLPD